jgi:hypothetical protein
VQVLVVSRYSISPGPTMQSRATGDFLKEYEKPRIGGIRATVRSQRRHRYNRQVGFCAFFSGSEIPFPGNGDRKRQRLGSNAGYAEGSPSMWCCRDHPLAVRAQNLIDDFNFTLHSLDRRHAVTLELLIERTTLLQSVQ